MGNVNQQQRRRLSTDTVPPMSDVSTARKHIIAALVVNQPGCLAHIANLFAARGYNIDSLVVGRTEMPQMSRMTVVMHANLERVEQVHLSSCRDLLPAYLPYCFLGYTSARKHESRRMH